MRHCQLRDNNHLAQLQSHGGNLKAMIGEIVFVVLANVLYHSMHTKASEQPRDLAGVFTWKMLAQTRVRETTDEKLTPKEGAK